MTSKGVSKIYRQGRAKRADPAPSEARKSTSQGRSQSVYEAFPWMWPDDHEWSYAGKSLDFIVMNLPDFLSLTEQDDRQKMPESLKLVVRMWNGAIAKGFSGPDIADRTKTGLDGKAKRHGFASYDNVLRFLFAISMDLDSMPDDEFKPINRMCNEIRNGVCKELGIDEVEVGRALRLLRGDNPAFTYRRDESRKRAGAHGDLVLPWFDPNAAADSWMIRFDDAGKWSIRFEAGSRSIP